MHIFMFIVGVSGLYFLLNMVHGLHSTAFTVAGNTISWFGVLFVAGLVLIGRWTFGK